MKQNTKGILSAVLASIVTGVLFSGLDYLLSSPTRPIRQYLILDLAWIVVWVLVFFLADRVVKGKKK